MIGGLSPHRLLPPSGYCCSQVQLWTFPGHLVCIACQGNVRLVLYRNFSKLMWKWNSSLLLCLCWRWWVFHSAWESPFKGLSVVYHPALRWMHQKWSLLHWLSLMTYKLLGSVLVSHTYGKLHFLLDTASDHGLDFYHTTCKSYQNFSATQFLSASILLVLTWFCVASRFGFLYCIDGCLWNCASLCRLLLFHSFWLVCCFNCSCQMSLESSCIRSKRWASRMPTISLIRSLLLLLLLRTHTNIGA